MATMHCARCGADYEDPSLEFCLADGSPLVAVAEEPLADSAQAPDASDPRVGDCALRDDEPDSAPRAQEDVDAAPGASRDSGADGSGDLLDRVAAMFGPRATHRDAAAADTASPSGLEEWSPAGGDEIRTVDGTLVRVTDGRGRFAFHKRYASGSLASSECYDEMRDIGCTGLARLIAHGQHPVQGWRHGQDYEILEYTGETVGFDEWIRNNLGEASALWFVRQAAVILGELQSRRVFPLWLEPASFMLSANRLVLFDYGKLLRPHVGDGGHLLTLPASRSAYAAAEVFKTQTWFKNSVVYSLGAIAMQLIRGDAPIHQATEIGDVEFRTIGNDELRTAVRGMLFPEAQGRWRINDLLRWSAGETVPTPDWSRLRPGASRTAFVLQGRSFHMPSEIAEPMLQDLDLAFARLDELLAWLDENPATREVANEIKLCRRQGHSSDWLVMRLAHRLDPAGPRIWRGISLVDDDVETNLFELGRRAVDGDKRASELVRLLEQADLRGVYETRDGGLQ